MFSKKTARFGAVLRDFLLFCRQRFVDCLCRDLSRAHCRDDRRRTGDRVAARVNVLTRSQSVFVYDDAAVGIDLKSLGGVLDQDILT